MSKKFEALKSQIFYTQQDPGKLAATVAGLITDVVTTVKVYGATSVTNDATEGTTSTYTGKAFSQYDDEMADAVTLSLKAAVTGVSIADGVVTIASTVTDGTKFTVKGVVGSVVGELEVTVVIPAE